MMAIWTSYRAECLAERARRPDGPGVQVPGRTVRLRPSAQAARRQAAEQRAALAPLKGEVAKAEAQIEALSRQIATIEAALADPDIYRQDSDRAQALARERGKLIAARAQAEHDWLAASEAYEAAIAESKEGVS